MYIFVPSVCSGLVDGPLELFSFGDVTAVLIDCLWFMSNTSRGAAEIVSARGKMEVKKF